MGTPTTQPPRPADPAPRDVKQAGTDEAKLARALVDLAPREAAKVVAGTPPASAVTALSAAGPAIAVSVLWEMPDVEREAVLAAAPAEQREQWLLNHRYGEDTVGRLMERAVATFRPETSVEEATNRLRHLAERSFITYAFITDPEERLIGILTFRDLLFARASQSVGEIMLRAPFALRPEKKVSDAMAEVVVRHFPVYPVADAAGKLVGQIRGQALFERQAFEISAQPGRMVGVENEERLATPWWRSLRFRHPWLQLNLMTAFIAAAVVGLFEGTIDRIVMLAAFLPVLAGQSGNTGCQALAVTLRGMTLGEMRPERRRAIVAKEALLGLMNGALVGVTAGLGMYFYARSNESPVALTLALVVFAAMTGACLVSGLSGVLIPLTLKRLGADPATASSIFLTTATDVVSMGVFLGLATILVP